MPFAIFALWSFLRPGNVRDFSNGSETVNFPGLFWWPKFSERKLQTIALSKERGQNQADVVIVAHNSRHCRYKWHHCRGCDNTESGGNDDCAALPEYMLSQKKQKLKQFFIIYVKCTQNCWRLSIDGQPYSLNHACTTPELSFLRLTCWVRHNLCSFLSDPSPIIF